MTKANSAIFILILKASTVRTTRNVSGNSISCKDVIELISNEAIVTILRRNKYNVRHTYSSIQIINVVFIIQHHSNYLNILPSQIMVVYHL